MTSDKMDAFTKQYIETALWASIDDNEAPMDANHDITDLSKELLQAITVDCNQFQERAGEMIVGRESGAGHDFWLTRNGHGAGFWDGDWSEDGDKLTAMSKTFGECNLYVGDDGKLYIS